MRTKKNLIATCLGCVLALTGANASADLLSQNSQSILIQQQIQPSQAVLVIFNKDTTAQDRLKVFNADDLVQKQLSKGQLGLHPFMTRDKTDKRFNTISDGQMAKITVPTGVSIEQFKKQLKQNPAVMLVIEDSQVKSKAMVNDPLFAEQASLDQANDHDLDAPEAWDISTGSKDVVVAVIDTGIDYTHPDLHANMWTNPDEIPNDGIDNDNNGYVDDIHGIDTWYGDADPIDGNDHGTNVAGIIGAVGNNNEGMAGINHDITMVACKAFSDDRGGSTSSIYECMNYLLALKQQKGLNIRVVNNSYSQEKDPIQDADDIAVWEMMVEKFAQEDMLFVVAASNEFSDNDVITQMPGNLPNNNVVTVASTMHNGRFAYSHSNYGLNTVHLGAPGVAVTSTESLLDNPNQAYYLLLQGTSFATPQVAGAAALALSINPDLSAPQLKAMLMATGDKLASLDQKTISGKRVNLHQMLLAADPAERLGFEASSQVEIIKGQNNSISLDLVGKNGFIGSANLSVIAPVGINASLSKHAGQAGETVNLIATVDESMAVGDHSLTLVANGFEQVLNVEVLPGALTTESIGAQTLALTPWLPDGVISSVELTAAANSPTLVAYDVKMTMDINHEKVGELELHLISPSGTKVEFLSADGIFHIHRDIREVFYDFRGEPAQGTWSLQVFDNAGGPWEDLDKVVGSIDWSLEIQTAGGTIVQPPLTCDQDPTQSQCIESCHIDSTQAHCALLCELPNQPSHDFCQVNPIPELTSGVTTMVSAASQEQKQFSIAVNEPMNSLTINTSGDNGDADLYVSFAAPSTSDTLCRSRGGDSNESCTIEGPQLGQYFITVEAYSAFSDLALVAELIPDTSCGESCCEPNCGGQDAVVVLSESNLGSDTQIERQVEVPAGKTLTVSTSGGTGDADLLVKFAQKPLLWDKDCYSGSGDNDETCTIPNTQAGSYFIVLDSAEPFSQVNLNVSYQ